VRNRGRRRDTRYNTFDTARETLLPFVKSLEDIRIAIGNDLTPQGVSAVSRTDVARSADVNGQAAARAVGGGAAAVNGGGCQRAFLCPRPVASAAPPSARASGMPTTSLLQ